MSRGPEAGKRLRFPVNTEGMQNIDPMYIIDQRFPSCHKIAVSASIRKSIDQAVKLIDVANSSMTRRDAREYCEEVAKCARFLQQAISNPKYSHVMSVHLQTALAVKPGSIGQAIEFQDRGLISPEKLAKDLKVVGELFSLHSTIITGGGGGWNYADELAFPSPKSFIATFVILLWERLAERKPDDMNQDACSLCSAIWQEATVIGADAKSQAAPVKEKDTVGGWQRPIRESKAVLRKVSSYVTLPPALSSDRAGLAIWNAALLANSILDAASVPVRDSPKK